MHLALLKFCLVAQSLACCLCSAETRWCATTGPVKGNTLVYPPIARAAHVNGLVVGHLIFEPSGTVLRLEDASGPVLLAKNVSDQVTRWVLSTDVQGSELCQTLLVASFTIGDDALPRLLEGKAPPGMYRVAVHAEVIVLSDPAGTISYGNPVLRMWHIFRSKFRRAF